MTAAKTNFSYYGIRRCANPSQQTSSTLVLDSMCSRTAGKVLNALHDLPKMSSQTKGPRPEIWLPKAEFKLFSICKMECFQIKDRQTFPPIILHKNLVHLTLLFITEGVFYYSSKVPTIRFHSKAQTFFFFFVISHPIPCYDSGELRIKIKKGIMCPHVVRLFPSTTIWSLVSLSFCWMASIVTDLSLLSSLLSLSFFDDVEQLCLYKYVHKGQKLNRNSEIM